jgi:hypothetical protein
LDILAVDLDMLAVDLDILVVDLDILAIFLIHFLGRIYPEHIFKLISLSWTLPKPLTKFHINDFYTNSNFMESRIKH